MFDAKEIYELGSAFLNSGEASFFEGNLAYINIYQKIAGVMNLTFACELYIRCLLNMAGSEPLVDKMDGLWWEYKSVRSDDAAKIEASVMDRLHTHFTFDEMLRDNSNAFYIYRYTFDPNQLAEIRKKPLRAKFLRVFAFDLYRILRERLA